MVINEKLLRKEKQLKRDADNKRMYNLAKSGMKQDEISKEFDVQKITVQRRISSFCKKHNLQPPKPRGRKAVPKKPDPRPKIPIIFFDYDKVKKRLANSNKTVYNINGIYQTGVILRCLEICPFMFLIAEFLKRSRSGLYGKLKYHLTEDEFQLLLRSLKGRRRVNSKSDCKDDLGRKIKVSFPLKVK